MTFKLKCNVLVIQIVLSPNTEETFWPNFFQSLLKYHRNVTKASISQEIAKENRWKLYETLKLNRNKTERSGKVSPKLSLIILNYFLIITDSFVLQRWGRWKMSSGFRLLTPSGLSDSGSRFRLRKYLYKFCSCQFLKHP